MSAMSNEAIMTALGICTDLDGETCEGCPYALYRDCKRMIGKDSLVAIKNLSDQMSEAKKTIDTLHELRAIDADTIRNLQMDIETWAEMFEQKYTKKQLVQAVNDIFDDTVTEDLNSTAQSVCAFLRLIDADGFMAILPDGTTEIRLAEGESECK